MQQHLWHYITLRVHDSTGDMFLDDRNLVKDMPRLRFVWVRIILELLAPKVDQSSHTWTYTQSWLYTVQQHLPAGST